MKNPKNYYVVTAYRWGDRNNHSYVIGVFGGKAKAIKAADAHAEYRGGKYECMVDKCIKDHYENDDNFYSEMIYTTVKP